MTHWRTPPTFEDVLNLAAERDRARDIAVVLEQQNAAALALHTAYPSLVGPQVTCVHCKWSYPCPTARALTVEP